MTVPLMHLQWAWPAGLLVAAVAGLLAGMWEQRAGRTPAGTALRVALVALLGTGMARPSLVRGAGEREAWLVEAASWQPESLAAAVSGVGGGLPPVIWYGTGAAPHLDAALDLGRRLVGPGGRLVIIGSGAAAGTDPESSAWRAAREGIAIDAVVTAAAGPDAAVTAVHAPATWRAGRPVPFAVALRADGALSATVEVTVDGRLREREALRLPDGGRQTVFWSQAPAPAQGTVRIGARVRVDGDVEARNDYADTVVSVAAPARVLVVGLDEGAVMLADVLRASGSEARFVTPEALPSRLSALAAWDALALVDVAAESLASDQLAALRAYTADLGRGLILTAGRQSFLAGGWQATALAELAPVDLRPPPREAREPVALLLLVDRSASMGTVEGRAAVSKLDLAREAASLAAEALQQGDSIGIVAYDESAQWVLPLETVDSERGLQRVEEALRSLVPGGGTNMGRALDLGLPALARAATPTRHALLVSDGRDSVPDAAGNEAAVRAARVSGVSLSAIAVGFDADRELLNGLARIGRGRFYATDSAADLPRLAVEESEVLQAQSEQLGRFRPGVAGEMPHAVLAGLDVSALPELQGYVAVAARDEAQVALAAPNGDPLLVTWSYGLGRVAAWLSDVGESWAWEWPARSEPRRLWAAVADYVAPAPGSSPPGVRTMAGAHGLRVEVDALDAAGRTVDLVDVTLHLTRSTGTSAVAVPQVAPGLYAVDVPGVARALGGRVSVAFPDGDRSAAVTLVPGDGLELRPSSAGSERLAQLAAVAGGRVLPGLDALAGGRQRWPLWPALLLLAGLVLPLDIAEQLGAGARRGRAGFSQTKEGDGR